MARKKRTHTPKPSLPLSQGEIWEIGRRPLSVHVIELAQRGERPEIFLAVQASATHGVVQAEPVTSTQPVTAVVDFTLQAMQHPILGPPRRPEIIRVASPSEAESLAVALAGMGLALEVCGELHALDLVHAELEQEFSGVTHDYRTRAAQAGAILSEAGLQAFFRAARQFYRAKMWRAYSDAAMFEIAIERAGGAAAKTYYGVCTGSMGIDSGIALYPSLQALQQFYAISLQGLEPRTPTAVISPPRRAAQQLHHPASIVMQLTQIPFLRLTYTPQHQVPSPLLQEATQLKLPLANKSAFPLVLSMGEHGLQLATTTQLIDLFTVIQAMLHWQAHLDKSEGDTAVDHTMTVHLPAVAGFLPATTTHTTLRHNPCLPDIDDDPEELDLDLETIFRAFSQPPGQRPPPGQQAQRKAATTALPETQQQASHAAATGTQVYTLDVHLVAGPMSPAYSKRDIFRRIAVRGGQTLHELHTTIFQAFGRQEEHAYEFNLGIDPMDRSQIYGSAPLCDTDADKRSSAAETPLHALHLEVGRRFGYLFDMRDNWAHVIEVVSVTVGPGKGKYPRVVKKVGPSPPQYADES